MPNYTSNLNLLKKDPATEGNDYFSVETMLNENWDKIDAGVQAKVDNLAGVGRTTETVKGNADAIAAHASDTSKHVNAEGCIETGTNANAEGYGTTASSSYAHAEGQLSLGAHGTFYQITDMNSFAKTITLDTISGLSVGDLLQISRYGKPALENIPISSIDGLVVTLNTTYDVNFLWRCAIKLAATQCSVHAEGLNTIASGISSHAEGNRTIASGASSHAEGDETRASGSNSHAEGCSTKASSDYAHVEGHLTTASGSSSHAEGYFASASGKNSHAEGYSTKASSEDAHAEGRYSLGANGTLYTIIAFDNTAKTITLNTVSGLSVGNLLQISIIDSSNFAYIPITLIDGLAVTLNTTYAISTSWKYAIKLSEMQYPVHAEGFHTIASGEDSHAEGFYTIASGMLSHAGGAHNQSKYAQTAIGMFGTVSTASDTGYNAAAEAFMIGNGTGESTRGLAFKVLFNGQTYADGAYTSTGADYAEYFEWLDGNPDNEDRVGYFVTLDGDKIRKAAPNDNYIMGIVSATPSVIGDNQDDHWQGKYLTDDWGRVQYHEVIIHDELDSEGNIIVPEHTEIQLIYNPDWDSTIEYISREKRKEWSAVGMMGKLLVRDDGTCVVNGFCMPDDNGIATNSVSGYRVMKRVLDNIIQVIFK